MADKFTKTYRYTKGIYEANFFSLANRDLVYHDSKLTDANIASSINTGEIVAGLGNGTQIMIFDSAKFNLTLTAQDIDLRQYKLQTGGTLGYNGKAMTCELITATGATLSVSGTPVAPYGSDLVVAYVNGDGVAYEVDPSTKEISGFTATSGQTYSVRYYIAPATNEVLNVTALFTPDIVSAEIKMPVYEAPVGGSANSGTLAGNLWAIIPRFQFSGEASLNATQTGNVAPSLSGQALAVDEVSEADCAASALSSLIYFVWEPSDTVSGIKDFAVIGGGLTVATGDTAMLPIKFVMEDGSLAQPDFSALTYATSASGTAAVANGVVTGVAEGDAEITVTSTSPAMSVVVPVTVTD